MKEQRKREKRLVELENQEEDFELMEDVNCKDVWHYKEYQEAHNRLMFQRRDAEHVRASLRKNELDKKQMLKAELGLNRWEIKK